MTVCDLSLGRYRFQNRVDDLANTRCAAEISRSMFSQRAAIAITNVRFALDSKGASPWGAVAAPGTELNLLFSLCGFGTKHGRPKVESLITILDEAKRPVRSPIRIVCGDLGSDVTSVNMKYEFTTDHPGSFFFHIEARDLVAEKHKLRCAIAGGATACNAPRIRETSRRASNVRPKIISPAGKMITQGCHGPA